MESGSQCLVDENPDNNRFEESCLTEDPAQQDGNLTCRDVLLTKKLFWLRENFAGGVEHIHSACKSFSFFFPPRFFNLVSPWEDWPTPLRDGCVSPLLLNSICQTTSHHAMPCQARTKREERREEKTEWPH